MYRFILLIIIIVACVGWIIASGAGETKLFRRLDSSQTGITFNNRIQESDSFNVLRFEYIYNGGGVGIGDFNNDGLQDVFFTGNQVSSRLYINKNDGGKSQLQFEDVTIEAGVSTTAWCTGVTVVDINQDGWNDLYISVAGFGNDTTTRANLLFVNQCTAPGQPLRFKEQARAYGLADMGYSTQTAFLDYDHDGDLDAYVLTNALDRENRNALRPKRINGEAPSNDRLYRNEGTGPAGHPVFTNVSHEAGITTEGYGLGIAVADLNGDGWEDIYCANDFLSNDLIWINNRHGGFVNEAPGYLQAQTHNAMGVDIADFNNDNLPDIMVVDMLPATNERQKVMLPGSNYERFKMDLRMGYQPQYMRNTLQLGQGNSPDGTPAWSEIGQLAGVEKTDWSWAPLFADFDNDGYRDLFITNGYRRDITNLDFTAYLADLHAGGFGENKSKNGKAYQQLLKLPDVKLANFCYRNMGAKGDLTFEDVSEKWGFDAPSYSNGAAYADLDNDGDLDMVINAIDDEAFVYENTLNTPARQETTTEDRNSWLRIRLDHRVVNGTKVHVYTGGQHQTAEFNPTRGYVSSVEPYLHFGLGQNTRADSVEIVWNDGQCQVIKNPKANQLLTIRYKPIGRYVQKKRSPTLFFKEIESQNSLNYTHEESDFSDFGRTPLLPAKHSQNGPVMVVGDANGDGLDDVFTGSDFGKKSFIHLQQRNGQFRKLEIGKPNDQEDTGALFFDADRDGDQDLYVVSGGSHAEGLSSAYQDRLYINNGNGEFSITAKALPVIQESGSCVAAYDFDHDGDLDLFRGSRLIPGSYPLPVKSYLLRNDNGHFVDVTAQIAPELLKAGIVTSAVWADFNRDGQQDLAICGEWMPVKVLYGKWIDETGEINYKSQDTEAAQPLSGWWNTLKACDFDNDGDMDFMAGNLGLNTKYKASITKPIEMYAADFDKNGRMDPILTRYVGDKKWLIPTRDILTYQIPSMKRRFPDFTTYAHTTFGEAFTPEEIKSAYHLKASEFRSMYFENTGAGFKPHPLPVQAQYAPVYGILTRDFNHDGHMDALLIGNNRASETIGGWQDASVGTLLLGNGKGNFSVSPESGLWTAREAKTIAFLQRADSSGWILIGNNGSSLQAFRCSL